MVALLIANSWGLYNEHLKNKELCLQIEELEKQVSVSEEENNELKNIQVTLLRENNTYKKKIFELEESIYQMKKEGVESENATGLAGTWEIGETLPIPSIPTYTKLFTDYRMYNIKGTPHNRLQQAAYTDKNGLRRFGDDYIVAMGSCYSTDIGDRFEVTFDTGNTITVILGDGKNDKDTDILKMYTPCDGHNFEDTANVLEFIIDSQVMCSEAYQHGSVCYFDELKGNITKLKYLGRDQSNDWTTYY